MQTKNRQHRPPEKNDASSALSVCVERFENFIELSSEGYWEQDENFRFTLITAGTLARSGIDPKTYLGTTRWDHGAVPVGDGGSWDKHKARLNARQPFSNFLIARPDAKGEIRYISTSGQPVFDGNGRFRGYRGTTRDVTHEKREELLLRLEHSVTRSLAEAQNVSDAFIAVIRTLCETEGWECGRHFRVDEKAGVLRFGEAWGVPGAPMDRIVEESKRVTYAPGAGLAGQVWESGQPLWVNDIATDNRVSKGIARAAGMHGTVIFPVAASGKTIGVLMFHSRAVRDPDERLLRAVKMIGIHIGQFVQRKEAERVIRESEENFRALTELSSDLYWMQDSEHRFTEFTGSNKDAPSRLIGKRRWDEPAFNMTEADWAAHKAVMDAHQAFRDVELGRVNQAGETYWVAISGAPVFDDSGNFVGYRGISKNVTARKRAELIQSLEHAVTRALAQSDTASAGLKAVMSAVCGTLGWECGRYFTLEESSGLLRLAESWYSPSPALERFIAYSAKLTFKPGTGVVGKAAAGEPQWIADISNDARIVNHMMSDGHGMRGAFMFPVVSDGGNVGVLSFTSREIRKPDELLLQAARVIGAQVGQFVQRKRTEEELRRFRAAMDSSADMVVLVDRTTMRYVDINNTVCRLLGYSRDELLNMGPAELLLHWHDRRPVRKEELERAHDELIANPGVHTGMRTLYKCKDGSLLPAELTRTALPSGGTHITVVIARDIRQQIAAEQALRESEERFQETIELAAVGIAHVDMNGRYLLVNRWLCELLGYTREELLQLSTKEVSHPDDRGVTKKLQADLRAGRIKSFRVEKRYLRKDGSVVWVGLTIALKRSPSGEPLYDISVFDDISARKQAEEALRESEDRFRHLSELSSDLFWEQDDQYRFTSFGGVGTTKLSETMTGKKRWEQTYVNMSADDWAEHIATLDARKPFRDLELCRVDESGRKVWISISGEPVFDASGTFKGYHGVGRNITEVRRNEQLLALEHAVNRGLANAESVSSAIQGALRAICESEGWECGRYWRVDEKAKLLRFGEAWGAPGDPAIARYIEASREVTYAPGTGINGRVWQSGEPVWASDRGKHAGLSESIFGSTRDIFMFPLIADGKTVGVFNFISRKLRAPDARLLDAVRVIGSQIAQFVQRKHAEEIVRASEERFRSLTHLSSDMYWEQDDQYRFTSFSGIGTGTVPRTRVESFIGRKRWEQNYVNMTADSWAEHISLLEAHKPFRDMELCRVDDKGRKIWISISGEPVFDASGVFKGYRGVGKDITERKLDEERIQFLANHDALTALPNRAMFTEVLNLAIQNARRYRRHFAVLFIDLDRFKVINDTLGHEAGDKLLQEMAKRLTRTVRSSDVVARLGGDEFVVLVHEVSEPKQVAAVARKILAALVQPLAMSQQEVRMTASIGICMYPNDAQDEQSLMKNADIAMYRAKEDGKNNYKYYSEEINVHSFEKLALETSLRRGLERDEFMLHYQAKLDLRTGVITGVEALVRWRHPDLGMVPPGQFIPLAEETGLIVPIGKWVLRTACAQVIDWQRSGLPPMRMAVNLSARQFADDNLVADIEAVLRETGIAPDLLELELTESMVIQNTERAGRVLAEIKRLGARLAIDDFGVGYSSLSHLKRFPIDTLKVDRSFIRDIPADPEDKAITEAIIAMGKSLSLTVVAEGVETREQQEFLREHACDEMQGFYFSKPIPPEQFAEFLRERLRKA